MNRKLTIKRVGNHLPTIILVGFLFFGITLSLLSLVGLPDCLLRKIEEAAAAHGIYLKIGELHLEPSKGLAARADGIQLYTKADAEAPLLKAGSVTASLHLTDLLMGQAKPKNIRLDNIQADIPVTDAPGKTLTLKELSLNGSVDRRGNLHITAGTLNLQGVVLKLSGFLKQFLYKAQNVEEETETETETETHAPFDLSALLAEYSGYTNKVYHYIDAQQWAENETPELRAEFYIHKHPNVTLTGEVPCYNFDIFHLRDARLNLSYKDNTITINNLAFRTVNPPSKAALQAAFEREQRNLAFRFSSTASLIPMLRKLLGEENAGLLNKITHAPEHAPAITLNGAICFEENYSLSRIVINGELEQKQLHIGEQMVDSMAVAFYYRNGDFNLNKLKLAFGSSRLNISASANEGAGSAEVQADVNIQETLALVNELVPSPVVIPEEIAVGERLTLTAKADLSTAIFESGQTDWYKFIPDISNLTLGLQLDSVQTAGITLTKPDISLRINVLRQQDNKLPTGAEKVELTLKADKLTTPQVAVSQAKLHLLATDIDSRDGDISIAELALNPEDAGLATEMSSNGIRAAAPAAKLTAKQLRYSAGNFNIEKIGGAIELANLTSEGLHTGKLALTLQEVCGLALPRGETTRFCSLARLRAEVADVNLAGNSLGNLQGDINIGENEQGSISLQLNLPSSPHTNTLQADVDWSKLPLISLSEIQVQIAPAEFQNLLKHYEISIPEIELPEQLTVTGQLVYHTSQKRVDDAKLQLTIPELVRTPCRVKPFIGQKVAIGLQADITLNPSADENYLYTAELDVTHGKDSLQATVVGDTSGTVKVTGTNTIRADVVDKLIDSYKAHQIIRDFDFGANSRNKVTEINVTVDYSDGLKVDSYCKAELRNVGYQLAVIQVDPQGNEKKYTPTNRPAYTTVEHATCYVKARVRYHTAQNGQKPKDECTITIGDIVMNYDNSSWLSCQDFSKLGISGNKQAQLRREFRNTTLKGDAVIIDVENSFVELVNVRGNVYPSYSLGMFYAPLHDFMADILMPYPVNVNTNNCVFPIYHDCKRPMTGNIRAEAAKLCGFRFLGTTIPLQKFNGFIHLTDDYVLLDRMNAACWQGVLNAAVKIGITGERTSFDGHVEARNMSLKSILNSYNTEFSDGLCYGELRFRSPSPELKDIQGYGKASIVNGDLMGFSLFQPIGDLVSDLPAKLLLLESSAKQQKPGYISKVFSSTGKTISSIGNGAKFIPGYNHVFAYDIQDAHAKFAIADGKLKVYEMKALGYNLNVKMKLLIDLDTLYIKGNLWPKITSLPTVVLSPVTFLSNFMIDILIFGEIDKLDWKLGLDRRFKDTEPSATADSPAQKYKPVAEKKKKTGS